MHLPVRRRRMPAGTAADAESAGCGAPVAADQAGCRQREHFARIRQDAPACGGSPGGCARILALRERRDGLFRGAVPDALRRGGRPHTAADHRHGGAADVCVQVCRHRLVAEQLQSDCGERPAGDAAGLHRPVPVLQRCNQQSVRQGNLSDGCPADAVHDLLQLGSEKLRDLALFPRGGTVERRHRLRDGCRRGTGTRRFRSLC